MLSTLAKLQSATKHPPSDWWDGAFGACWLTVEACSDFLTQHGAGKLLKKYIYYHFSPSSILSCSCLAGIGLAMAVGHSQAGEWGTDFWRSCLNAPLPGPTQKLST